MSPMGKNLTSDGVIAPRRILAWSATEGRVQQAAGGAAEKYAGVSGIIGASAAGQRVDVFIDDIVEIEAGGVFAQGDYLTADAQGRGVVCAPGAGVLLPFALKALAPSGATGQIVQAIVAFGSLKG